MVFVAFPKWFDRNGEEDDQLMIHIHFEIMVNGKSFLLNDQLLAMFDAVDSIERFSVLDNVDCDADGDDYYD